MKIRIIKEVGLSAKSPPPKYEVPGSFRGSTDVKVVIVKSDGSETKEYDDERETLATALDTNEGWFLPKE